jgi:hypothetical protein
MKNQARILVRWLEGSDDGPRNRLLASPAFDASNATECDTARNWVTERLQKNGGAWLAVNAKREVVPANDWRAANPVQLTTKAGHGRQDVLMFMPGGVHSVTLGTYDGKPVDVTVLVDPAAAERIEKQREALTTSGKVPFFSIQHRTQIAAAWVKKFFWGERADATGNHREGIWAEVEWTESGKQAIEGKDFRSFSPVFAVDAVRNTADNPAQIICNEKPTVANMGALENSPAFKAMSPFW